MDSNFSLWDKVGLGNRLRDLRTEQGLSQEQVANMADITPAYFGQVERGTKNVTVHTLEKICMALNISLAEFFSTPKSENIKCIDEISNQILHQLNNKSESEKQAVLRMVKLVFQIQNMK